MLREGGRLARVHTSVAFGGARRLGLVGLLLAAVVLFFSGEGHALAATPQQDVADANASVQRALTAARDGDLVTAKHAYDGYETTWFDIEDGVRANSRDAYVAIEKAMTAVAVAFAATPPNASDVATALAALDRQHQAFIGGQTPPAAESSATQPIASTSGAATSPASTTSAARAVTSAAAATSDIAPAQSASAPSASAPSAATSSTSTSSSTSARAATDASGQPTIGSLLAVLGDVQAALGRGDFPTATARLKSFETTWLDVEGQVKTRSADDYRQTETDMALAESLAAQSSPQAVGVVERMRARLQPYAQAQRYGIFDAAIILLREGLEALLVIVALSAFLKRSGNKAGEGWLWSGALVGLGLSVLLGVAIQVFFGAIVNPGNRELMEGTIGLVAAAMLVYVSYWLHSKASLSGWQNYISARTNQAIQGGRLFGVAVLAFLAVFREGAETALFYLGMAANISNTDLFIGLGLGFLGLAVLGFLMVVAGMRIPMRPFFTIASLLVFYLCFKFIGTGIHALQVAAVVPSGSAAYLPSVDVIGLYPTWPTTIAQLLLLGGGMWVVVRDRFGGASRAQPQVLVGSSR
jgi:high-affinity iron transporter